MKASVGIVVGQCAVGKSWFIRQLNKKLSQKLAVVSEGNLFIEAIRTEHNLKNPKSTRYINFSQMTHYHPWCKDALYHSHEKEENDVIFANTVEKIPYRVRKNLVPFTQTHNDLTHDMRKLSCEILKNNVFHKKSCIFELTVGVNINNKDSKVSSIDYSSLSYYDGIKTNEYDPLWLKHVAWVVVIHASWKRRIKLNYFYTNKSGDKLLQTESPLKEHEVLKMSGKSDFLGSKLEKILRAQEVPRFVLENTTDLQMKKDSSKIIQQISRITSSSDLTSQQFRHIL